MTPVETMTDEELSQAALDVLEKELGVLGMARFLRLTRAEGGDYTRDRHNWQDGLTIDQIVGNRRICIRRRRLSGKRLRPGLTLR